MRKGITKFDRNGQTGVKQGLCDGIEAEYCPNSLARDYGEGAHPFFGLVLHDAEDDCILRTVRSIKAAIGAEGLDLRVCCAHGVENEIEKMETLLSHGAAGLFFIPKQFTKDHAEFIRGLEAPAIVIFHKTDSEGIPCVAFDHYKLAKEATMRLIELNHRELAFIGGPLNDSNASERQKGFLDALQESGQREDYDLIRNGNGQAEDGYTQMESILEAKKKISAVITDNDELALGAIQCLKDYGIEVPDAVSVFSLNNGEKAENAEVPISGVECSYSALGQAAADLLLNLSASKDYPFEKQTIPYTIHLRKSVAKV